MFLNVVRGVDVRFTKRILSILFSMDVIIDLESSVSFSVMGSSMDNTVSYFILYSAICGDIVDVMYLFYYFLIFFNIF